MKYNLNAIKKLAVTGSLILAFAAFGAAQTGTTGGATPDQNATATKHEGWKDLNLSADQKAKIKSIREQTKQQMQAVKADNSLTAEQKKAKMKEIRENSFSQINSQLTPEQQQKFAQMRAQHKGRHHRGMRKNKTS